MMLVNICVFSSFPVWEEKDWDRLSQLRAALEAAGWELEMPGSSRNCGDHTEEDIHVMRYDVNIEDANGMASSLKEVAAILTATC